MANVTIIRAVNESQLSSLLSQASASVTYAPIVPTTQTGFRNRIINGDFRIDQRNNGALKNNSSPNTALATTFGADRWLVSEQNTGTGFSQRASDGTGADKYYLSISRPSSLNALIIAQRIEAINSYDLAGKTVTLSFRAAILGGYTSLSWKASYANTTDSFGSFSSPTKTQIATGNVTVGSSFNSYSATFTVPSEATTGIEISFYNTNISFDATTLRLSNVQLELGSSATPFEQRPIGTELALCQRYYQTSFYGSGVAPGHNASGNGIIYHPGVSGGISGNIYTNIRFAFMRVSPTVNIWNGNNASATPATASLTGGLNTSASGMRIYTAGGVGYDSTNIGIDYIRNDSISLYAQASTGGAASGILAFGYSLNAEL
jgi:hypothetical protein